MIQNRRIKFCHSYNAQLAEISNNNNKRNKSFNMEFFMEQLLNLKPEDINAKRLGDDAIDAFAYMLRGILTIDDKILTGKI